MWRSLFLNVGQLVLSESLSYCLIIIQMYGILFIHKLWISEGVIFDDAFCTNLAARHSMWLDCETSYSSQIPDRQLLSWKHFHLGKGFLVMTPTHQALLPGRCSRITGQVVQQAIEVVRLGPLNRTARCPCKQGFLTLSKMHVKTPLKFWFHMHFSRDYDYVIVY